MRSVVYTLMPDVAGKFLPKSEPLDVFAKDLQWVFLYKRIPPMHILNEAFAKGSSPREAEWKPFKIDAVEYAELVEALCRNESERFQVTSPPDEVCTLSDWLNWVVSWA